MNTFIKTYGIRGWIAWFLLTYSPRSWLWTAMYAPQYGWISVETAFQHWLWKLAMSKYDEDHQ